MAGNGMDVPSVGFVLLAVLLAKFWQEFHDRSSSQTPLSQAMLCIQPLEEVGSFFHAGVCKVCNFAYFKPNVLPIREVNLML